MSNTATFKVKIQQEVMSEVTLPVPSYYRNGSYYVMIHSEREKTVVRSGGLVDAIEFDDLFSFNPTEYKEITREEFEAVYNDCEKSIRNRTFYILEHSHYTSSLTGS